MKLSKYTTDIVIDEEKSMIYNTLSRQYYLYIRQDKKKIWGFLNNINKGSYTQEEIELFKILLEKKIILPDKVDELAELKVLENAARFQERVYKIMVYTTNACNFRCTYCEQEHIAKVLQTDVMENILKLVQHMSKKVKKIKIDWFGGEPLLEYKKMQYILEKANSICDKEGCELYSTIATNGYLLSDELLEEMKKCNLQLMQITLDGKRTVHDARRKLVDGSGTFEKILENINKALEYGIRITLRINIDEQNVGDISEVLEGIPLKYRSLVYISISNIFQNKELLSTYQLLKKALDMGFSYAGRENTYVHCHACLKNAAVIDTDGSILLCSNTKPEEKRMGYLDNSGQVRIERLADYYKLKSTTALDNPECRECIELPYCIGSCKYSRMQNNKKCLGRSGDGMMLKERALLDYYYDLQKSDKVIE